MVNSELNFIFQQDTIRSIQAKIVSEWFAENNINVLDWVIQSSDMNFIEHLWEYLDRKIRKKKLSNIRNQKAALKSEWMSIMNYRCYKCVKSKACLTNFASMY